MRVTCWCLPLCCRLYVMLLQDYLNEVAYPAELAGLRYSVSNNQVGTRMSMPTHELRCVELRCAVSAPAGGVNVLSGS